MGIRVNVASSFDPKGIDTAISSFSDLKRVAGDASLTFGEKATAIGDGMVSMGTTMTAKVTAPIVAAGAGMFAMFTKQEDAVARMTGALAANGGQANVTAEEIQSLASRLQQTTTFGDEATISAAGLLLTFHNIRNELGEGNQVFDRTLIAAQDLSAALGTDLESSTMQLAKALENPIQGMSALSRSGTTFTQEQKDMVKALVESGDQLGAQTMILDVVEGQYAGMAETMASTSSGQIKQAMNALGDAGEQLGEILAPAIQKVVGWVQKLGHFVQNLTPSQKEWAVRIAAVAAAIGPLLIVGGKMIKMVGTITTVIKAVGSAMSLLAANPVVLIIAAIAALVAGLVYAYQNFEGFRNVVDTVAAAIATAFTWLWETVLKPIWDLIYWYIQNVLIRYIQILWTVYSEVFKAIAGVVTWAWNNIIKPIWDAIYNYVANTLIPTLQNLWDRAKSVWEGVSGAISTAWGFISGVFTNVKDGIATVATWFGDRVDDIKGAFSTIADAISSPFKSAFNLIVRAWNSTLGKIDFTLPTNPLLGPLSGFRVALPQLQEFAKGGIVPGIPGQAQLAIVHSGERILRRSEIDNYANTQDARRPGGDVNVYVNQPDASAYDIGREILWQMKVAG
jgi:TP901 family phage tail tape measure protein